MYNIKLVYDLHKRSSHTVHYFTSYNIFRGEDNINMDVRRKIFLKVFFKQSFCFQLAYYFVRIIILAMLSKYIYIYK